ncbi:MAG: GNAT family N-acetyltransferase [Pseudomonadota bacterium]
MTLPHERPTASAEAAALASRIADLIPVIETERCRLRAPQIEDFPAHAEIACSERGLGIGGPMNREAAWADFVQLCATWLLRGHGAWTVEDRTTREVLGFVAIGFEPGDLEPELGYMFRETAEGRGLASEAVAAARDHGFGALHLPTLVSYVDDFNTRSRRLAERLGAARDTAGEAQLPGPGKTHIYRHPAPEARS